jgi:hypothetical protein
MVDGVAHIQVLKFRLSITRQDGLCDPNTSLRGEGARSRNIREATHDSARTASPTSRYSLQHLICEDKDIQQASLVPGTLPPALVRGCSLYKMISVVANAPNAATGDQGDCILSTIPSEISTGDFSPLPHITGPDDGTVVKRPSALAKMLSSSTWLVV